MTTSAPALRAARMSRLSAFAVSARRARRRRPRGIGPRDGVVAQQPDLHALDVEDRRLVRRLVVLAQAGERDPVLPDVADRLEHPRPAGVTDVVVGERHPVDARVRQALDVGGVGREARAAAVEPERVGGGVLEVGDGEVRALDEVAHRAAIARPVGVRQVPAERRAVLAGAGDVHRAAVEREVDVLRLDRQRHAAVEEDVAAGDEGPGGGRVVARRRPLGHEQARGERPVGQRRHAVHAEQRVGAPGERPDRLVDVVRAQERERLAVLRQPRAQVVGRVEGRQRDRRGRRGSRRASRGSRPPRPRRARGRCTCRRRHGIARTSAVRTAVRPDRKFVTGTIATSDSTSAAGAADADGASDAGASLGDACGSGDATGASGVAVEPAATGAGDGDAAAPAEATEHDAAEPDAHAEDERDDDRGDEPRRASRGGLRRPRGVGGIADGHARQGSGRGPLRRRRRAEERPVRAGGRGVRRIDRGWRTRPDSNRRSPA